MNFTFAFTNAGGENGDLLNLVLRAIVGGEMPRENGAETKVVSEIYRETPQEGDKISPPAGIDPEVWAARAEPEHHYWRLPIWAMLSLSPGWKTPATIVRQVGEVILSDSRKHYGETYLGQISMAMEREFQIGDNCNLAVLVSLANFYEVSLSGLKLRRIEGNPEFIAKPRPSEVVALYKMQRRMSGIENGFDPMKCPLNVYKIFLRRAGLPTSLAYYLPRATMVEIAAGDTPKISSKILKLSQRYDEIPRQLEKLKLLRRLVDVAKSSSNKKEAKILIARSPRHWVEEIIVRDDRDELISTLLRVGCVPPPNADVRDFFYKNFCQYADLKITPAEELPFLLQQLIPSGEVSSRGNKTSLLIEMSKPYPFTQERSEALLQARVEPWITLTRGIMARSLMSEENIRKEVEKICPAGGLTPEAEFILSVYYYIKERQVMPQEGEDLKTFRARLWLEKLSDQQLLQLAVVPYTSRNKLIKKISNLIDIPGFFLPVWREGIGAKDSPQQEELKNSADPWAFLGCEREKVFCRNGRTKWETFLENSIFDSSVFVLAFGTLRDYRMFELEEIRKSAFRDEAGITFFRRPDDIKKSIPLSQVKVLLKLVSQIVECSPSCPSHWWLNTVPDVEAADFLPWCQETLDGMKDRIDFDDEALSTFKALEEEERLAVAKCLREIFHLGMYYRRWKGPGHPFPTKAGQTGQELGESLPKKAEAYTDRVLELLEALSPPARKFLDDLLVVSYSHDGTLQYGNKTFSVLWQELLKGEACIRVSSLLLVGTGYHFLDVLSGEKIPGLEVKEMDRIQ